MRIRFRCIEKAIYTRLHPFILELCAFETDLSSSLGKSRVYNFIWFVHSHPSFVDQKKKNTFRTLSQLESGTQNAIGQDTRDTHSPPLNSQHLFLFLFSSFFSLCFLYQFSIQWFRSILNFSLSLIHKSKHEHRHGAGECVCVCVNSHSHIDKLITIALQFHYYFAFLRFLPHQHSNRVIHTVCGGSVLRSRMQPHVSHYIGRTRTSNNK